MVKTILGAGVAALALVAGGPLIAQSHYGNGATSATQEADTHSVVSAPSSPSAHGKVRPEIAKPLQEAITLNDAKDYAGALAKIREADAITGKSPDEEYTVAKFMGSVALHMNDFTTATAAFNRAVASGAIPDAEKPSMLYIAMTLNAQAKNYAQAITLGEQLTVLGPLDEKAALPLAQSYYNKGDFANALKIAEAALVKGVTDPSNKSSLLEVQRLAQAHLGNTAGFEQSLEQQCMSNCSGHEWGELVGLTMSKVRPLTDHAALNLYRLKLVAGGMEAADYDTMSTLDLQLVLPAEAKSVLENGIAAGTISRSGHVSETLGRATPMAARDESSLAAFEREAAAKATGEEDVKLGESYYTHGQLAQAETALRRGLGKPGVKDPADAHVTLGIVLLAEGKKDDAIAQFNAASGNQAQIAHIWAMYAGSGGAH